MKIRDTKLFFYLLLFCIICNSILYAGTTGKIAGIIKDEDNGEPLPGVNVYLEGTTKGAATDLDGYYVILQVPPGVYTLKAAMVGYKTSIIHNVRVNIDQTTEINTELSEVTLDIGETIEIYATRPVVEKDVAASRANLTAQEIESIPIVSVEQAVGLQAGIVGLEVRGSNIEETAFVLNGITLRNERDNTPFTGISYSAVEEIQVQSGGFSAEYGNIRGGMVNVVTREGSRDTYNFSLIGRYKGASAKHFGPSPNSPESYWIRPYVDPAVAWTGTANGAWDKRTQEQYPTFEGWNEISRKTFENDDPSDDLSPQAAQQLYLWEHRRQLDIQDPDYILDMSFGGPVPYISEDLGGLRFQFSYRRTQNMYLIPLSEDAYRDYTYQLKLTSDIGPGKKLMIEGLIGRQTGTNSSRSGGPGLFSTTGDIAEELSNGPKYIDARMFNTDYWNPSTIDMNSIGLKYTNAVSPTSYYDISLSRFESKYHTDPGVRRDTTKIMVFGNSYYVDESPYNWEERSTTGIDGMRMGAGMSNSRDTTFIATYTLKADLTTQFDRYNKIKTGIELAITDSRMNYALYDKFLFSNNTQTKWDRTPIRGGLYFEDKLEFNSMIASLGLRLDYFHAGGDWYADYNPYDPAFSGAQSAGIDTLLPKEPTKQILELSPRLNISFPISENSKLFFNYGHFRQLPTPENLYILRRLAVETGNPSVQRIGSPNNPLPRTIAYELGFEQNLWDEVLIRAAGYYKDITDQPRLVNYQSYDGSVDYDVSEPNSYEDIRGFEITLNKNRGLWVRGFLNYTYMVYTYGYYGYRFMYENPVEQRDYIRTTTDNYQTKPVPRPYARLSMDFFTPDKFGPALGDVYPLESWNINILGSWRAGTYSTWTGSGGIPGIEYNVQWRDYWNFDLRISKNFKIAGVNLELFVDVNNVLNYHYMSPSGYGFVDTYDRSDYFQSLHLPGDTEGVKQFGYINIPGDDRPGEYRDDGVAFVPIIARANYQDNVSDYLNPNYLYYFTQAADGVHGTGYHQMYYDDSGKAHFRRADQSYVDQVLEDKAYIDMPNLSYFTFLDPRNIFWGLKISFGL